MKLILIVILLSRCFASADILLKTDINFSLNEKMRTLAVDYLSDMTPVYAEIAKSGWVFHDGETPYFERKYVALITRTPEHQAVVEARGEVRKGENTYESKICERVTCGFSLRKSESEKVNVDKQESIGLGALSVFRKIGRYPGYLRDL